MTMRLTFGIDPGLSGAIVALADGEPCHIFDIPVVERNGWKEVAADQLSVLIRDVRNQHPGAYFSACLERVGARPGDGGTSAFRFGEGFGKVKAVLEVKGIPFVMPVPAQWKRYFGLLGTDKDAARLLAITRFPGAADELKRKKDQGRADALLLALYLENTDHAGRNAA